MTKTLTSLLSPLSALGARLMRFLKEQNDRHIALWGASLQHKRRYTHPEQAKRYRAQQ